MNAPIQTHVNNIQTVTYKMQKYYLWSALEVLIMQSGLNIYIASYSRVFH